MQIFFRNLPVFVIFASLAACSWVFGGSRASLLKPVLPWLWAFLVEVMLFFPQRRPYEDGVSARSRAWQSLKKDPILYVSLILVLLLAIPFANRGLCAVCDYPAIMAGADPEPRIPIVPFCVDVPAHYGVFMWFLVSLTALLAAKHALSRHGKQLLVEMMAWNGAALAVLGFLQHGTGASGPLWTAANISGWGLETPFFSVFGYQNMGGVYFVMMFAFSIGVWQTRVAEAANLPPLDKTRSLWTQLLNRVMSAHYALIAAFLNFLGVFGTLSRAAMMQAIVLAVLAFLYHECALVFARRHRARMFKRAGLAAMSAILLAVGAAIFAPDGAGRELGSVSSLELLNRVTGKREKGARVAMEIFKEHPLCGVGGWGFRHFCVARMSDAELKFVDKDGGGANVHNDYLQFLCEHGATGFGCMVLVFLMLVAPLFLEWYKLQRAARFATGDSAPPRPRVVYCLPAGTFWILAGNVSLLLCATGDCPMRSMAVLTSFFVSLACADGYLPRDWGDR